MSHARRGLAELAASQADFAAVDQRMIAVLSGEPPTHTEELIALGRRAYDTQRFAIAARFFGGALKREPALADNRKDQHAYNAACCAALAGSSEGIDEPPLDEEAKAQLRGQALAWLTEELERWKKHLEFATTEQRQVVAATLMHWQNDVDLTSVRDGSALDRLPDNDRMEWKALWESVAQLLTALEK
jgi:hypothetical protein